MDLNFYPWIIFQIIFFYDLKKRVFKGNVQTSIILSAKKKNLFSHRMVHKTHYWKKSLIANQVMHFHHPPHSMQIPHNTDVQWQ